MVRVTHASLTGDFQDVISHCSSQKCFVNSVRLIDGLTDVNSHCPSQMGRGIPDTCLDDARAKAGTQMKINLPVEMLHMSMISINSLSKSGDRIGHGKHLSPLDKDHSCITGWSLLHCHQSSLDVGDERGFARQRSLSGTDYYNSTN